MKNNQNVDLFSPVLSSDQTEVLRTYTSDSSFDYKPLQKKRNKKINSLQIRVNNQIKADGQQETQKELDEWIAARKARFPTRARIQAKEAEKQSREERGALDLTTTNQNNKKPKNDKPIEMSASHPTYIPSFLDKLNEDEERKKRSIVLQCFRYFVQHGFLQPESPKNEVEED